jgi:hypothetical protein
MDDIPAVDDGPVVQSSGYTFYVGHDANSVVLGMTSFEVAEARKLAGRILAECDAIEATREVKDNAG